MWPMDHRSSEEFEIRPVPTRTLAYSNIARSWVAGLPLGEVAHFHPMHGRPAPDLPLLPMVVCRILAVLLQAIPAWIFKPGDPSSVRIALEHKGAIVMTDKHIGQAVAADISGHHGHRRVKLGDFVLGPR